MANNPYPIRHLDETNPGTVTFYVADTDAGKPVSGMNVGDLCWAVDTGILYVANSATTWGGTLRADYVTAGVAVTTPGALDGLRITSINNAAEYASLYYGASGGGGNSAFVQVADGAYGVLLTVNAGVYATHTAESGTYTPTLTNVTNLTASTAYQCQYQRVGLTVTVSGRVDVDPTLGLATELGISLPIASNFGATEDCGGAAFATGIAGQGAGIRADATNNRAAMAWVAADITNQPMYFTFTYQVI